MNRYFVIAWNFVVASAVLAVLAYGLLRMAESTGGPGLFPPQGIPGFAACLAGVAATGLLLTGMVAGLIGLAQWPRSRRDPFADVVGGHVRKRAGDAVADLAMKRLLREVFRDRDSFCRESLFAMGMALMGEVLPGARLRQELLVTIFGRSDLAWRLLRGVMRFRVVSRPGRLLWRLDLYDSVFFAGIDAYPVGTRPLVTVTLGIDESDGRGVFLVTRELDNKVCRASVGDRSLEQVLKEEVLLPYLTERRGRSR